MSPSPPAPRPSSGEPASPPQLTALVERAQAGDRSAFGILYDLRVDSVYRFAVSSLRNPAQAEDATALTFLKAWEKLSTLRAPARFDSWLFQIAYRQIVDQTRARQHAPLEAAGDPEDEGPFASPSKIVQLHDDNSRLHALLLELTEEQRAVLILRFLRGMSHAEVAEQLGKSELAARGLQHRALQRLRELLERDDRPLRRSA